CRSRGGAHETDRWRLRDCDRSYCVLGSALDGCDAREAVIPSGRLLRIRANRGVMQHEKPAIVFENENVRRVCPGALDLIADGAGDAFETGDPRRRSLDFD